MDELEKLRQWKALQDAAMGRLQSDEEEQQMGQPSQASYEAPSMGDRSQMPPPEIGAAAAQRFMGQSPVGQEVGRSMPNIHPSDPLRSQPQAYQDLRVAQLQAEGDRIDPTSEEAQIKREEALQNAIAERRKSIAQLAMVEGAAQVGQAFAGNRSGNFESKMPAIETLKDASKDEITALAKGLGNRGGNKGLWQQSNYEFVDKDGITRVGKGMVNTATRDFKPFLNEDGTPMIAGYAMGVDQDPVTGRKNLISKGGSEPRSLYGEPDKTQGIQGILNQHPRQQEQVIKINEEFFKDTEKDVLLQTKIEHIRNLINSYNQAAVGPLKSQMAKTIALEVGTLNEGDIERTGPSTSLMDKARTAISLGKQGFYNDTDIKSYNELIDLSDAHVKKVLQDKKYKYSGAVHRQLNGTIPGVNVSRDDAYNLLGADTLRVPKIKIKIKKNGAIKRVPPDQAQKYIDAGLAEEVQ